MAYTEKVLLSGTALSFLFYECINSANSQEGFLLGDVTSEITNHISDTHSENARLDTQIVIRTVLPLPSVSLFYLPTGRIKEDVLSDLLSSTANEIVGWYKYRKNTNLKPTFRDKLISKGLQKYFEKYHGKKTFVTCNLTSKTSSAASTHTFMYRFGKINCFDMYEYVEDITANLGEKFTGYKKAPRLSPHSIFSKIVRESNVQVNNTSEAIFHIQEAVDLQLAKEARIAAQNESIIREIETEIKGMASILTEKQSDELYEAYDKYMVAKDVNSKTEMAQACLEALHTPLKVDILNVSNVPRNCNDSDSEDRSKFLDKSPHHSNQSPPLISTDPPKPILNYAAALKTKTDIASTSKENHFNEDLITFDIEDKPPNKTLIVNEDTKCSDSSPEY